MFFPVIGRCHGSYRDGMRELKCCPEWFLVEVQFLAHAGNAAVVEQRSVASRFSALFVQTGRGNGLRPEGRLRIARRFKSGNAIAPLG